MRILITCYAPQNDRIERTQRMLAEHCDQYLEMIIAGRVFGGRQGESMQRPREFDFDGSTVVIRFATTEKLTAENPSDLQRGEYGQLIIPRASRVASRVRFAHYTFNSARLSWSLCRLKA